MKIRDEGTAVIHLRADRHVGSASAPCAGYYALTEHKSADATERLNCPSMFDIIERAIGGHPEIGSEFSIKVTVNVVKHGDKSPDKCHNPWPSHRCR